MLYIYLLSYLALIHSRGVVSRLSSTPLPSRAPPHDTHGTGGPTLQQYGSRAGRSRQRLVRGDPAAVHVGQDGRG